MKLSNIAGIDLGTTFSGLAILNSIGKPETVPNSDGERITPSAVYFPDDNQETVLVGHEAINARAEDVTRSARWIKRYMGDPFYPEEVIGKKWTPAELSSLILRKLKEDCSKQVGEISEVVITVPAYFDEIRRKATMDAGKMAGLNVIGIVNEPTAAALFYASEQSVSGKILVFDLGGGTFDVTVMNVHGKTIDIICSTGDHQLGGYEFDQKLVENFRDVYSKEKQGELFPTPEDRARYEIDAEEIKRTLSKRPTAKTLLVGDNGSFKHEISREQFEESISALTARIDMLVEDVLDEAELKPGEIDKILLVGGSTRIPVIQKRLEKMFGKPPTVAVNVDECVALGAALHAGLKLMEQDASRVPEGVAAGLGDIKLKEVCGHCYGTIIAALDAETGRNILSNDVLIPKNTTLPCQVERTYYTAVRGQTAIEAKVTQHVIESTDPDLVNIVAVGHLDLPPNRETNRPVKVRYSYDTNQRMHCVFEDEESGRKLEMDIDTQAGHMSQSEVERRRSSLRVFQVE
ncbi:MAG: Hsp70 family protein [Candidatus Aegiribacteria sp.]|nr:Hsp70 family protein [Candidatus Aegiribacteria sp.]